MMEGDGVCGTCLRRAEALVKECVGQSSTAVCSLCLASIRKLRAFEEQCAVAAQLLADYSTSMHTFKNWNEFCQFKNLTSNGLQVLNTSSTFCLDVTPGDKNCDEFITNTLCNGDSFKRSTHHIEQYTSKFVEDYPKAKTRKRKQKDRPTKRKIKKKHQSCDDDVNYDDISLNDLFKKKVCKSKKQNNVEKTNADSSIFESKIDIKQEFCDFQASLHAVCDSMDDDTKEDIPDIKQEYTKLIKDNAECDTTNRGNDETLNEMSGFEEDDRDPEDDGNDNAIKYKPNVKKKKKVTAKKKSVLSELEVTGLLMFDNEVSDEEQIQDMKRRKEDKEYINSEYKCEMCFFGFKFHHALETHMKKHEKKAGDFECWLCHQRFPTKGRLGAHRRSHHSQKMWCGVCTRRFYNKTRLKDHVETHKGFFHKCDVCSRSFQSKGSLTRHVVTHQESPDLKCQYCSRVLKSKESFKSHILMHLGSRPHVCPECPAAFSVRRRLDTHILRRHRPPSGQHYCVECDFHFKTATDYKTHLSTKKHTDPSLLKFSCTKCSRRYATEAALSRHTAAMHERVLQYACAQCPSRYATTQGLNFHRRKVHEGYVQDKKYPCAYCHKSFISKALMESHMRTHTGEQPFQCSECGRAFTQRSSMHTHVKLVHLKKKNKTENEGGAWEQQQNDTGGGKLSVINNPPPL